VGGLVRVQIDGACLSLSVVLTAAVKNRTELRTSFFGNHHLHG